MSLRAAGSTAGWGLFAASSWAWCIGMYLPVILLRELGWPGFLAFAIPNVLGVILFGYVWSSRDSARAATEHHARAMVLFSVVSCTFHVFFATFVITLLTEPAVAAEVVETEGTGDAGFIRPVGVAVVLWVIGLAVSMLPPQAWMPVGAVAYAFSMTIFAVLGTGELQTLSWSGTLTTLDLVFLAPAFAMGFLACPFLDLTFHRVLQESPSRHAFLLFGVAFIPMLLFTAAYASGLTWLIFAHLAVQSVFTVGAHFREVRESYWPAATGGRAFLLLLPLLGLVVFFLPGAGEDHYLRFLGPYALIFPAYVLWYVAAGRVPSLGSVVLFTLAMIILLPCYEMAFVGRMTWAALIPVAAVIGRACVRIARE